MFCHSVQGFERVGFTWRPACALLQWLLRPTMLVEVRELRLFLNPISVYGAVQLEFQGHGLHAFPSGVGKCSTLACKINCNVLLLVIPLCCIGSNVWIFKFCAWQVLPVLLRFVVHGFAKDLR